MSKTKEETQGSEGWSTRATSDMAALSKRLNEETNKCLKFRTAYRLIYWSRKQEKKNSRKEEELRVDYDELWSLGEINMTVI